MWPNLWPRHAVMVKLVNTTDLKSVALIGFPVQVRVTAPPSTRLKIECLVITQVQSIKKLFRIISLIRLFSLVLIVTLVQLVFNLGHKMVA